MLKYNEVPACDDMICYAPFYEDATRHILKKFGNDIIIVEIGTRKGCSARIFLETLPAKGDWTLSLIDPFLSPYAEELLELPRVFFSKNFAEDVVDRFEDDSIALLHLDSDPGDPAPDVAEGIQKFLRETQKEYDTSVSHGYEHTKNLFNLYKNKIKDGGLVIFHDATDAFGVNKFVKELEKDPDWLVTRADPQPLCPIAAPAMAIKLVPKTLESGYLLKKQRSKSKK
jgi:hypothetical protein